jgi:hypothetical protein
VQVGLPCNYSGFFRVISIKVISFCRLNFTATLNRLHTYADGPATYANGPALLARVAAYEQEILERQAPPLPARQTVNPDKYSTCRNSFALLQRCQPSLLDDYVPVAVYGDANCLLRSVSLGLYGKEDHHIELRARAALEIAVHRQWFDCTQPGYCAPFKDEAGIVAPDYNELCNSVTTLGTYSDVMCILALSSVTGVPIQMYFPPLTSSFASQPLTRCVSGRGVQFGVKPAFTLMWSSSGPIPKTGPVEINHFVPLLLKQKPVADVVDVSDSFHHDEVAVEQPGPEVKSREVVDAADGDDDHNDDDEPPSKQPRTGSTCSRPIEGDGNGNDTGNRPQHGKTDGRFKSNEDVYHVLSTVTPSSVLSEVPRGRKANCFYVIDNSDNFTRKASNQANRFWDDCGTWDRKQGRNLTSVFVTSPSGMLSTVKHHDGSYCVKKRVDKKVIWQPLEPQPDSSNIVTLHSYYATLKADNQYRKRVTWLEAQPQVAIVEYIGEPPTTHEPHGLARVHTNEYVRTKPKVLDSMRVALEHRQRSRQVYECHVLEADSFEAPRDQKQVRNLAQSVKETNGSGRSGMKNVADDIQVIINGVQDNDFVQTVVLSKGKSPVIVCYLPDQVKDMQRFCGKDTPASLRSVLGVDRTFNLGPCFVTTLVYKNMAVNRKTTSDHPIFLGPVMFHFDGKMDSYVAFFHICPLL